MFGPIALAVPLGSAAVHLGDRVPLIAAAATCLIAAARSSRRPARRLAHEAGIAGAVDTRDLARQVRDVSRLTGRFVLRSGRVAEEYFDKYQFEADPVLLDSLTARMAALVPAGTQVLAGLELGGIPVVTALGRHTGLPCAFVRKVAKEYGTAQLVEGAPIAGRRVLVVEDVVTSGGQIVISTGQMRELGAEVHDAVCVLDRQEGGAEALATSGIRLRALLTRTDLEF
jgi:orotate phosphoribosyltransferase